MNVNENENITFNDKPLESMETVPSIFFQLENAKNRILSGDAKRITV